jgi:hypothetical protein
MKLLPALAVTAVLAAVPATVGVTALASDLGSRAPSVTQPASAGHSSERGDDGGHHGRGHGTEPGDDNGGHGGDDD